MRLDVKCLTVQEKNKAGGRHETLKCWYLIVFKGIRLNKEDYKSISNILIKRSNSINFFHMSSFKHSFLDFLFKPRYANLTVHILNADGMFRR